MQRKITITAVILLIILAGATLFFYLGGLKKDPKKMAPPQLKRYVKAVAVTYQNLPGVIESSGRIKAFNEITISAEVGGRLTKGDHIFKEGQSFREGEIVALVTNDEFTFQLKAKKSKFLQAVATILPDLKIDFPETYSKWMAFFESINIQNPLPELPASESSKERIYMASRNILNDYYAIKSDEARLIKHTIIAPFDGTLKDVAVEVGGVLNSGTRLATYTRNDLYELELPVEAQNIHLLAEDMPVQVENETGSDHWTGSISRVGHIIDPTTQSVKVYVSVKAQKGNRLYDGQYLSAIITGKPVERVMEMPRNAVYNGNEVYVFKDAQLHKHTIRIAKINNETLYFNGLDEGAELVIEPVINITNNSNFEIIR